IYTCITGGYDPIRQPLKIESGIDYYCFTDQPQPLPYPWIHKPIELPHLNAKDQNRYIKMLPHLIDPLKNYNITLYIDGSIQIVNEVGELLHNILKRDNDIFIFDHPQRTCIYEEAKMCAHFAHDKILTIAQQMRRYRKAGYPINNGLFEANVIIRRNTSAIQRLMDAWWSEYKDSGGAKRDQLSLPYVAWKESISIGSMGRSDPRFIHQYFLFISHQRKRHLATICQKYINRSVARIIGYDALF
ncbi:MAG: DUF616 domain-containing protein, partial [Streptococcus sp.]|nr:DUF616 domain-containing protein [Streptococcus sp.]